MRLKTYDRQRRYSLSVFTYGNCYYYYWYCDDEKYDFLSDNLEEISGIFIHRD